MITIEYEEIFSRFRNKVSDPKELSLPVNDLIEIYTERLNSVIGNPRIRKLFLTFNSNDELQQLNFELEYPEDDSLDKSFVIEIFVLGMIIEWLEPQVNSIIHTSVMIGGKEEKKILDNHKNMIERLDKLKKELNKKIRDYGYIYNSYTNGGN